MSISIYNTNIDSYSRATKEGYFETNDFQEMLASIPQDEWDRFINGDPNDADSDKTYHVEEIEEKINIDYE
jgi:hypothetical protein